MDFAKRALQSVAKLLEGGPEQRAEPQTYETTSNVIVPPSTVESASEPEPARRGESEATTKTEQLEPVVKEVVKPMEVRVVQPVIDRYREVVEVHKVIQPIYVKEVKDLQVEERMTEWQTVPQGSVVTVTCTDPTKEQLAGLTPSTAIPPSTVTAEPR